MSEIVNLKTTDIDSNRKQIMIREAKGKKDTDTAAGNAAKTGPE